MTRKGFQALAECCAAIIDPQVRDQMMRQHIATLKGLYPRFDADKFESYVAKKAQQIHKGL